MNCIYCAVGFHFLCNNILHGTDTNCCCVVEQPPVPVTINLDFTTPPKIITTIKKETETKEKRRVGRPEKEIGEFEDQLSSGRKRAAKKFKIEKGTICEWAWRKNNGGGIVPVCGCSGRAARHIHHGPDKSTLNNDRESNISLVCTYCHQLWHVRNDGFYTVDRPLDGSAWLPDQGSIIHELNESEPATPEEIIKFELSIDREITMEDWERIRDHQRQYNEQLTSKIVEGAES